MLKVSGAIGAATGVETPDGCVPLYGVALDLEAGDQVEITDKSNDIVGILELEKPYAFQGGCVWDFTGEVPAGGGFYKASVRGVVSDVVPEPKEDETLSFIMVAPQ